jgi:hypothetical protein
MRLHHMGYPDSRPIDEALEMFQEDHGLDVTGTLDDATKSKLGDTHGALSSSSEGNHGRR